VFIEADDRYTADVIGNTPCDHPDCPEVLEVGSVAFRARWEPLVFCSRDCRVRDQRRRQSARWRAVPKNQARARELKLLRKYGISQEEWDKLHDEQLGRCAICLETLAEVGKLGVDHDHATGEVRGLLCSPCNVGLGYFRDDPERLIRAVEYLDA
jgi:hypothetical protein